MTLFLQFLGLVSSLPKDSIRRYLNLTIGLIIVYPDESNLNITTDPLYQDILNSFEGPFNFSTCKYSEYIFSDKTILSKHRTNIIITRDNKFLKYYDGIFSVEHISNEINQAFYSYVEILNESTLSNFKKDSRSLFLLTGPSILKEYEDASFYYRHQKVRFGFIYQNRTNKTFISLCYIKNKHKIMRFYDETVPIIQFIRSCKTELSTKYDNNHNFRQFNAPKHSIQFSAIIDNYTDEIRSIFEYLKKFNYNDGVDFDFVYWENANELKKKCQIEKTNSNLSFVIYPKIKNNNNGNNDCLVFQDIDFYSKELLYFFILNSINDYFYKSYSNDNSKIVHSDFEFDSNARYLKLTLSNFSAFIPSRNIALVFIDSKESFSHSRAEMIFNALSNEFKRIEMRKEFDEEFVKPVEFYKIEYKYNNLKLPSADNFPVFAIFKPFNKQAIVFNQIFTIKNIRNWILKFATEDEMIEFEL